MNERALLAVMAIPLLLPGAQRAQAAEANPEYEVPDFIREPPALPDGEDPATARRLTLPDAIQIAAGSNLGMVLKKEQLFVAQQGVPLSQGRFEPVVNASVQHSNSIEPPLFQSVTSTSTSGAITQDNQATTVVSDVWTLGYSQELRSGATVSLGISDTRTAEKPSFGLPPLYDSGVTLQITQPLLRGFGFSLEIPYADVLRARFSTEQSRQSAMITLTATVKNTEDAYWDLVQALKNYQVQKSSLKLADDQLKLTRRQIDSGVLPPSDLINAEGTQARGQLSMVQAETQVQDATDHLRSILNLPRAEWFQPILPVDAPRFEPVTLSYDEALTRALANRPELKQREVDLQKSALDLRVAKVNRLPEVDATLSYGLAGQGFTNQSSINQLLSGQVPTWMGMINLTWTPLNRTSNAAVAIARSSERVAQLGMDQQLLDLTVDLRAALRSLDSAVREVRAAAKFRGLAERSLDAEQRKFLNGTSSNFFIAQRQADLESARVAELAALIRHHKATTAVWAATGTLLETRGVQLEVGDRNPQALKQ